jgi:hypothetical protein
MLNRLLKLAGGSKSPVRNVGSVKESSRMIEKVSAEDIITTPSSKFSYVY